MLGSWRLKEAMGSLAIQNFGGQQTFCTGISTERLSIDFGKIWADLFQNRLRPRKSERESK